MVVVMGACDRSQELNEFKEKHAKEIRVIEEGRQVGWVIGSSFGGYG